MVLLLSGRFPSFNLDELFQGYKTTKIEINGVDADKDKLREALSKLPKVFKVEIK